MLKQYPAADGPTLEDDQSVENPGQHSRCDLLSPSSPILVDLGGQTWIVPKHIFRTAGDPTKSSMITHRHRPYNPQVDDTTVDRLGQEPKLLAAGQAGDSARFATLGSNPHRSELVLSRGELTGLSLHT